MVKLTDFNNDPLERMNTYINEAPQKGDKRGYLGLSIIGHKCHRFLQFVHYGTFTKNFTSRITRLFSVGHEAEPRMIKALNSVGIHVTEQQLRVTGKTGHVKGHIDGNGNWFNCNYQLFSAEPFLVEFKTHNQKSFNELLQNSDLRKTKPIHYSQMISYMGYQEQLKGLYVAENKNDSTIHVRVIDFDEEHFKELQRKEIEVVTADTLLPRIGNNSPKWFECKMCDAKSICFGESKIESDCRNCQFVDVLDGGKWHCSKHLRDLYCFSPCAEYETGDMFKCIN